MEEAILHEFQAKGSNGGLFGLKQRTTAASAGTSQRTVRPSSVAMLRSDGG
jgi:hypothetical protein